MSQALKIELRVTMETIVLRVWFKIESNSINMKAGGENLFIWRRIV